MLSQTIIAKSCARVPPIVITQSVESTAFSSILEVSECTAFHVSGVAFSIFIILVSIRSFEVNIVQYVI
jgi:hypothetical protein